MNAFSKSTALWFSILSVPLANLTQAADRDPGRRHVMGVQAVQQVASPANSPANNPQKPSGDGQAQGSSKGNGNANGARSQPFTPKAPPPFVPKAPSQFTPKTQSGGSNPPAGTQGRNTAQSGGQPSGAAPFTPKATTPFVPKAGASFVPKGPATGNSSGKTSSSGNANSSGKSSNQNTAQNDGRASGATTFAPKSSTPFVPKATTPFVPKSAAASKGSSNKSPSQNDAQTNRGPSQPVRGGVIKATGGGAKPAVIKSTEEPAKKPSADPNPSKPEVPGKVGLSSVDDAIRPADLSRGSRKSGVADGHTLHVAQRGPALAEQVRHGTFDRLVDSKVAKQVDLKKQFEIRQNGDMMRRLNLGERLAQNGGWQHRLHGPIDPLYGRHGFNGWYCGSGCFPSSCWFPRWSPWVGWCWNFPCVPICDPRPIWCRPIVYDPSLAWMNWVYPVWTPMPVAACGTWVDVPTVVVDAGYDVQLLAVRFVDSGHPEQQVGPRYRVWIRNNSPIAILQPFNLLAYASNDRTPAAGLPEAGLRVTSMEAGQIQALDLRLPFAASTLSVDADGQAAPFRFLHVIADSHREVPEVFEDNNGAVLARGDILPVDPALFAADSVQSGADTVLNLAGEGFGPEPGQVLVTAGGQELQAEIVGWYDLGVQIRVSGLSVGTPAELVVVRGDQAASNPLSTTVGGSRDTAQADISPIP